MNKSISYFLILAFTLPLMGQEVEVKDETKQEVVVKQGCAYNTEGICISCQAPHLNKGKQCRIKKKFELDVVEWLWITVKIWLRNKRYVKQLDW